MKTIDEVKNEIIESIIKVVGEEKRQEICDYYNKVEIIESEPGKVIETLNKRFGREKEVLNKKEMIAPLGVFENNLVFEGKKLAYNEPVVVIEKENNENYEKYFGTNINVRVLTHEMCHALAAKDNFYIKTSNGYIERVGLGRIEYQYVDGENVLVSKNGIALEEACNTCMENKIMANLLGVESEDYQELSEKLNEKYNEMSQPECTYSYLLEAIANALEGQLGEEGLYQLRMNGNEDVVKQYNDYIGEHTKVDGDYFGVISESADVILDTKKDTEKYMSEEYDDTINSHANDILEIFRYYNDCKEEDRIKTIENHDENISINSNENNNYKEENNDVIEIEK